MKTARFLAFAALLLAYGAVARATDPCNGNCLPTGTTPNESRVVLTEDYPWVRATIWCVSPATPCQGTTFVDAQTCPSCPWTVMHAITNPKIPDANGRVCAQDANGNYICDVYLDPRMYAYRCNVGSNYGAGVMGCNIEPIK